MTFRILVADTLSEAGLERLRRGEGVEVEDRRGIEPAELIKEIVDYDALVVRSRSRATAEVITAGGRLKVIGRAGIGVDNIDIEAATRAGVIVMNTPDGNATTTAEHTIALMMSMARMIPQATASLKAQKWEKKKFVGRELRGKTLGIVGLGNIGRIVADRARGLQMKVLAFDPYFDVGAAAKLGFELAELETVMRRADVVTVHTPINNETRGLIGNDAIELMKPGVMLVNCARGGIYDEAAVVAALDSGKVAAAAFDVFVEEPVPEGHPLVAHPKCICTPHLGASTSEAQEQVAIDVGDQIVEFAAGGPARNAINMPRVTAAQMRVVGPFVELARRMGSFVGQVGEGELKRIEVTLAGEFAAEATHPVTTEAVVGALKPSSERPVNSVNARMLAQERDIEVADSRIGETASSFSSTIKVAATFANDEVHSVVGTIFANDDARFVAVDGIRLEAVPEGDLLFMLSKDHPGVIGRIGQVIGEAKINISRMHLGLDREDGRAISLINVDKPLPAEVLAKLTDENVLQVRQVHL